MGGVPGGGAGLVGWCLVWGGVWCGVQCRGVQCGGVQCGGVQCGGVWCRVVSGMLSGVGVSSGRGAWGQGHPVGMSGGSWLHSLCPWPLPQVCNLHVSVLPTRTTVTSEEDWGTDGFLGSTF